MQPGLRITALESEISLNLNCHLSCDLDQLGNPAKLFFIDKFAIPMNDCSKIKWDNNACEEFSAVLSMEHVIKYRLSLWLRKKILELSRGARIAWLSLEDKYFSTCNGFLTGVGVTLSRRKIILGCCQDWGDKVRFDGTKITIKSSSEMRGWAGDATVWEA